MVHAKKSVSTLLLAAMLTLSIAIPQRANANHPLVYFTSAATLVTSGINLMTSKRSQYKPYTKGFMWVSIASLIGSLLLSHAEAGLEPTPEELAEIKNELGPLVDEIGEEKVDEALLQAAQGATPEQIAEILM